MEVTRLRELPGDRVEVEVDGAVWRTLPAVVVARAGVLPGATLDRPRLRAIARERRRARALGTAGRILRARELSARALDERLARRGITAEARADALSAAERAGLVDDVRYARRRAEALAVRARGDGAIRWHLDRDGVAPAVAEEAVASLTPEAERAAEIVARRGRSAKTARYLASRGFGADAVERACGADGEWAVR